MNVLISAHKLSKREQHRKKISPKQSLLNDALEAEESETIQDIESISEVITDLKEKSKKFL